MGAAGILRIVPRFHAGVAELADARDSKSRDLHWSCGFDPHLQHQIYHHFRVYLTAVLSPEPLRMSITAPIRRWFTEHQNFDELGQRSFASLLPLRILPPCGARQFYAPDWPLII